MSIQHAKFKLFKLTFGFSLVLVALIVGLLVWANTCMLEESVSGFGELVPEVKESAVRATTRGLIVALFTEEQKPVKAGQTLVQNNTSK